MVVMKHILASSAVTNRAAAVSRAAIKARMQKHRRGPREGDGVKRPFSGAKLHRDREEWICENKVTLACSGTVELTN